MMACVFNAFVFLLALSVTLSGAKESNKLQIGVKHKPSECSIKAKAGDKVSVHYEGRLTDGTVFDSSLKRGDPIAFTLGKGQVIQGWDRGISGMCIGEKRKLKVILFESSGLIPSHLGYGEQGSPPTIPGGATLIFETELMAIE